MEKRAEELGAPRAGDEGASRAGQGGVHVKVCGLTCVEDAVACVELGVSAIGLNFVPASPRCLSPAVARDIVEAVGKRTLVVGVVANLAVGEAGRLRDEVGLGCLQLHGDESAEELSSLLPHAYKAIRVGGAADVDLAANMPGKYILVDAKVAGVLGGSGVRVEPSLVAPLAQQRRLMLAGGLTPENVAAAIVAVRPWAVDVASGVEGSLGPRRKDLNLVAAFLRAVASVA